MEVLKPPLLKILNFKFVNRFLLIGGLITLIGVFAWTHATLAASESTTTRKAGGLDFTARGGKKQGREVPQSLKNNAAESGAKHPVWNAQRIGPNVKNNENEKIRIIADKLFAEIDAGVIEFVGNVKATQAETVVSADRLKIIYTPDAVKGQTNVLKPASIEKIIASGHVKINYNNIIAETDEAEYTIKSEVLVLKGEQSTLTQEGHSIIGTKFTLHRTDGKITVESSAKNRVKAVFQPSEKEK
jgi:lipopolysaccharide export system protein LptA